MINYEAFLVTPVNAKHHRSKDDIGKYRKGENFKPSVQSIKDLRFLKILDNNRLKCWCLTSTIKAKKLAVYALVYLYLSLLRLKMSCS